jgi:nucleoside-diphosphate-sugar epimerase
MLLLFSPLEAARGSLVRGKKGNDVRATVIGATGHIGTYLIPRLVAAGHEVVAVSRGKRTPYQDHPAWGRVETLEIDRDSEEAHGTFGRSILETQPDFVIDLICFTAESARHMVESLSGKIQLYLSCGTVWVHGHSTVVPATEDLPRNPFGSYGIQKAEIERLLFEASRISGFPAVTLMPGHIVGPGWTPVNPAGNLNLAVFSNLASGKTVTLPNIGMETLHHVHADDVAQSFMCAIANWRAAVGESFHVVSPAAVTLRGYAEAAASWFGREASLAYLPWEEWKKMVSEDDARATWDHIAHSPNYSIEKARRTIGYSPRYSSFEALLESVTWLKQNRRIA